MAKEKTLREKIKIEGKGLYTGELVSMTLLPLEEGRGIVFKREDVPGCPEIRATLDNVASTERRTTLRKGDVFVHTVEHVLSALYGMGVDNVLVLLNGPEPPAMDGDALPLAKAIAEVGTVEQNKDREVICPPNPINYHRNGVSITLYPLKGKLSVSYSIYYEGKLLPPQYLSLEITPEVYLKEIAPARTYVFYEDLEEIKTRGLAKCGSPESALIFKDGSFINGPLRFEDEPVRHKILDIIGDIALIGKRIEGHIVAEKAGHAHHIEFAKKVVAEAESPVFDIMDILSFMPHRYPFLLVDRILEVSEDRAKGLKNVTFNEPFFQGHFPGDPIMPGVLIIEAMAQVGGVLLLSRVENRQNKLLYFSGIDGVRFRRPVRPGDQIVFEVELLRFKGRVAKMKGEARVDGELAASGVLMATIVEKP